MYRKTLLASVGAIVLGGSTALAADLPMTPPPPPVPVFTWTDIYGGGQIGYAWGSGNLNYSGYDPFDAISFDTGVSAAPRGVMGGAHAGYNFQVNQWCSASKARSTGPACAIV